MILLQEKVDQGLASHRREERFGGVTNDGSNRDEVAEGKRTADYKSVISGNRASDFSPKTPRSRRR
jgi:hypothetical protein